MTDEREPQDALQMALRAAQSVDQLSRDMAALHPDDYRAREQLAGRVYAAAKLGSQLALISLAADIRQIADNRAAAGVRSRGGWVADVVLAAALVIIALLAVLR